VSSFVTACCAVHAVVVMSLHVIHRHVLWLVSSLHVTFRHAVPLCHHSSCCQRVKLSRSCWACSICVVCAGEACLACLGSGCIACLGLGWAVVFGC
jgi:hypothetical protein